jgi:hypothetical protein
MPWYLATRVAVVAVRQTLVCPAVAMEFVVPLVAQELVVAT